MNSFIILQSIGNIPLRYHGIYDESTAIRLVDEWITAPENLIPRYSFTIFEICFSDKPDYDIVFRMAEDPFSLW